MRATTACTGDGIITDPRNCHFDPGSLQCPSGTDQPTCLTPAQVTVARHLYQGPVDPQGRHLYPGGFALGSEGSWGGFQIPAAPPGATVSSKTALVYGGLSLPYLRYQYLPPGPARARPGPVELQRPDVPFAVPGGQHV